MSVEVKHQVSHEVKHLPRHLECGYGKFRHLYRPCDHHHVKRNKAQRTLQILEDNTIPSSATELGRVGQSRWTQVTIQSAYYGPVPLNCLQISPTKYALLYPIPGKPYDVYVKVIDAQTNKIDIMNPNKNYTWRQLGDCYATVVDVEEHASLAAISYPLRAKEQRGETLTDAEQKQMHDIDAKLHPVDIHFAACNYVNFLHKFGQNNITDTPMLICVHNAKDNGRDIDNAFFMGTCMVFGNGFSMFRAMGTLDIAGHEFTHGLVTNLAYQGHAGAMNEACADAGGVAFEQYVYDTHPTIQGKADFLMGEDNTIGKDNFLRSLADPPLRKQPKQYRDTLWGDPNAEDDEGNVHINSGLGNYLFYLVCQAKKLDIFDTFQMFKHVYSGLPPYSTYPDFRDAMKKSNPGDADIIAALKAVWLTDDVVTDWYPKIPTGRTLASRKRGFTQTTTTSSSAVEKKKSKKPTSSESD